MTDYEDIPVADSPYRNLVPLRADPTASGVKVTGAGGLFASYYELPPGWEPGQKIVLEVHDCPELKTQLEVDWAARLLWEGRRAR